MKNEPIKRVHTNLDLLMHQNNIKTDKQLAQRLGWEYTPQNTYARLSGNISMKTLVEISDLFDVSIKELLR